MPIQELNLIDYVMKALPWIVGPVGGLALAVLSAIVLWKEFKQTNQSLLDFAKDMAETYKKETQLCNERYDNLVEKYNELETKYNSLLRQMMDFLQHNKGS